MTWVYDTTLWTTSNLHQLKDYIEMFNPKVIQKAINKSDQSIAREIVDELQLEMPC